MMLFNLATALLIATTTALAVNLGDATHFFKRQYDSSGTPAACQSSCASTENIYNACINGTEVTCLTVCQPANFQAMVSCFNCVLADTPGDGPEEYTALQQYIQGLQTECDAVGTTVGAFTLTQPSGAASPSGGGLVSVTSAGGNGNGVTVSAASTASIAPLVIVGGSGAGSSTPAAAVGGASSSSAPSALSTPSKAPSAGVSVRAISGPLAGVAAMLMAVLAGASLIA